MPRYRKKPVEVEAHIFSGSSTSAAEIHNWMETGTFKASGLSTRDIRTMEIQTLEGVMTANPGDYIIKGIKGEFYPCKPDIFIDSYDIVDNVDRQPGVYQASKVINGDEFDYCGKTYTVTSVENFHDQTKIYLSDSTSIAVRPWTELTVTATGK